MDEQMGRASAQVGTWLCMQLTNKQVMPRKSLHCALPIPNSSGCYTTRWAPMYRAIGSMKGRGPGMVSVPQASPSPCFYL